MCWHWARIFEQAIASVEHKCFTTELGVARNPTPDGTDAAGNLTYPVHIWVKVFACGESKDECKTSFDDGLFSEGTNLVHPSPFPPRGLNVEEPIGPWIEGDFIQLLTAPPILRKAAGDEAEGTP